KKPLNSIPYENTVDQSTFQLSSYDAEKFVVTFRTQRSKYFPFLYISSDTCAQQILQERPFLWLYIMAVSSTSTTQQMDLGNQIRHTIARKMLIQNERNIELLLGLLTYIGWVNYQVQNKPSLSVSMQLAMSLVFELGLNKPPPKEPQGTFYFNHNACPRTSTSIFRTMEERRAVLGCFIFSSIVSAFLQKIDALRWTSYMEECLQTLAEKQESPMDEILVQRATL
ncbi:hypothetical protein AOQ84DRAFT_298218, partial [Glonium stellatum]